MKILLVCLHSKYVHSALAAWYLKNTAQAYAEIEILESTIKEDTTSIFNKILSYNADLVAFSCYIWNIHLVEELLYRLKSAQPSLRILLGGPEVSYRTKALFLKQPAPDYILCGEGEEGFSYLLQTLANGQTPRCAFGLCTKEQICRPHISCEDPISAYTDEYFQKLNGRIAYIETSRGCPFSCSYCLSGRLGGVRFFELSRVEKELERLSISGTQTIKFVDRTFNCNEKRALHILRYLLSQNPHYKGVCYHFEMAGDLITPAMIELLNSAPKGLFQIEVGVQSFNEATLHAIHRATNIDKVCKTMRTLLKKGHVHIHMDLIAGLALEDFSSFRKGFDKLFSLQVHRIQLGFLKRLEGSPLAQQKNVGQFSKQPPYEVLSTPWLNEKELLKLHAVESALDRLYNSGRFKSVFLAALQNGCSAFDLFLDFETTHPGFYKETPFECAQKVLSYFSDILGEAYTKDLMKEQWLKINSSGVMPLCLQDKTQKGILQKTYKTDPRIPSVKRSAAVLYHAKEIVYVDYTQKDPVLQEFTVKRIPFTG